MGQQFLCLSRVSINIPTPTLDILPCYSSDHTYTHIIMPLGQGAVTGRGRSLEYVVLVKDWLICREYHTAYGSCKEAQHIHSAVPWCKVIMFTVVTNATQNWELALHASLRCNDLDCVWDNNAWMGPLIKASRGIGNKVSHKDLDKSRVPLTPPTITVTLWICFYPYHSVLQWKCNGHKLLTF